MAKTKQQKFTDSLRQDQINTFSDGLNMDLHPLTTPNTILTDCVNGTMITYNDNEFVLQNERGNTQLENVFLSPGFIPVGMKEHNGILYIVSYNPESKETEIGTFPSPKQTSSSVEDVYEKFIELSNDKFEINYSEQNLNINYYDCNTSITTYDKYRLKIDCHDNPLYILEHYILNKNGIEQKVDLLPSKQDDKPHRFSHVGEGILGYRYRPYEISSFETNITPVHDFNVAKLNINFQSNDPELIANYKNIKFKCTIESKLKSETGDKDITIIIPNKEFNLETYQNLEGRMMMPIIIKELDEVTYDPINGVVIDSDKNKYNKISIDIKFYIETVKGSTPYRLNYNNHNTNITVPVSQIWVKQQIFKKFTYSNIIGSKNRLTISAVLDMAKYDPYWTENSKYKYGEATYKFSKINKYGELEGNELKVANTYQSVKINNNKTWYKVFSQTSTESPYIEDFDLLVKKNDNNIDEYYFAPKSHLSKPEHYEPVKYTSTSDNQTSCKTATTEKSLNKVQYIKTFNNGVPTYNIVIYNDNGDEEIISYGPHDTCLESLEKMIDERWAEENRFLEFLIEGVPYSENNIYLFTLSFTIDDITNTVSFIIITNSTMLVKGATAGDDCRLDMLNISEWYGSPTVDFENNITYSEEELYCNDTAYETNIIPIDEIKKCESDIDAKNLAIKKFLKFTQIYDPKKMKEEIPSVTNRHKAEITFEIKEPTFDYTVDINADEKFMNMGVTKFSKTLTTTRTYNSVEKISDIQKSQRKYLCDLLKKETENDDSWNISNLVADGTYYDSFIKYNKPAEWLWLLAGGIILMSMAQIWRSFDQSTWRLDFFKLCGKLDGYYLSHLLVNKGKDYEFVSNIEQNEKECEISEITDWLHSSGEIVKFDARVNRRKGYCNTAKNLVGVKQTNCYKISNSTEDKDNLTINLMKKLGFKNIGFGKIKTDHRITYDNKETAEKIWFRGKTLNNPNYVLLGMKPLVNSDISKKAWECIKQNGYILENVQKDVVMYTYGEEIITKSSDNIIKKNELQYKIYPSHCQFIYRNNDSYNIQSLNNLNPELIKYSCNAEDITFNNPGNINIEYLDVYLKTLAILVNKTYELELLPISETVINQEEVQFDFSNNISINYDNDGKISISKLSMGGIEKPELYIDLESMIPYKYVKGGISVFKYDKHNCVRDFKWNYSEDFLWNVDTTQLNNFDTYKNLWFYKLSNYEE